MSSFVLLTTGCKVKKISIDSLFHGEQILCGQLRSRRRLANRDVDIDFDEDKGVGDESHKHTESTSKQVSQIDDAFLNDVNFDTTHAASEQRLDPETETAIENVSHQFLSSVQPPAVFQNFQNEEHEIIEQDENLLKQSTNIQNDELPKTQNIEHESAPYPFENALNQDFFPWNDDDYEYENIENENIDIKYEVIIDWENSDYKPELPETIPLPDELTCEKCGTFFPTKQRLEKHLLVHSGIKDFPCPQCHKQFNQKSNLTTHVNKVHKKRTKFRPPIQNVEQSNQTFSKCNRTLESNESIQQLKVFSVVRVPSEHPNYPKPPSDVSCTLCLKKFSTRDTMRIHFNSFHLKKRVECPHCDKSYTQSHSLREHIKIIHLGEKYSCQHCGKAFCYKNNLKAHITSFHKP